MYDTLRVPIRKLYLFYRRQFRLLLVPRETKLIYALDLLLTLVCYCFIPDWTDFLWMEVFHLLRARPGWFDVRFTTKYLYSRILAHYFLFPSWWELPGYIPYLGLPLVISWYIYDPYLILHAKGTQNSRFDYCMERFPLFMFVGILPTLTLLYAHELLFHLSVLWIFWCYSPNLDIPRGCGVYSLDISEKIEKSFFD